jgi:hypothetical protein
MNQSRRTPQTAATERRSPLYWKEFKTKEKNGERFPFEDGATN